MSTSESSNGTASHTDHKSGASSKRDQELVAEAKRRARDQHHYLRSSTAFRSNGPLLSGGGQETKEGVASGLGGVAEGQASHLKVFNPPVNFALVTPGVYRSGFPKGENFDHLKSLHLKSILTLVPEEYPEVNVKFVQENGIKHFQVPLPGNKEPFVKITARDIKAALSIILDRNNHPLLIHCNKGKHRTGCVVGCLRKIQNWALAPIFVEYREHADPKARLLDERFIELFDERCMMRFAGENGFLPQPSKLRSLDLDHMDHMSSDLETGTGRVGDFGAREPGRGRGRGGESERYFPSQTTVQKMDGRATTTATSTATIAAR
ncbi:MAG: hypothetical protein M1819_006547 [Sarea resinae]|nr:MAG: hypothetical protein M1819_006547 [Sarea resinae]